MNKIIVSAPAGSGMTYATHLLKLAFNNIVYGGGHERHDIEDKGPQVIILRDPYDTIASGAERWVIGSGHKEFQTSKDRVEGTDIEALALRIKWEEKRYLDFFKNIEDIENIKILSFELLTQNASKFIEESSSHFGYSYTPDADIENKAMTELKLHGYESRAPREKFPARKIIESLMSEKYDKQNWECWRIYSELKAKLDKDGL